MRQPWPWGFHQSAPVLLMAVAIFLSLACRSTGARETIVTFPGSAVGTEAEVLAGQLERFMREHPGIRVDQRTTPDAADQRHQLYVQWLNAGASDPDILQLDVIWTPEFAAAEWILPLDRFQPETGAFFPATIAANRWDGRLHAVPWFVDVGMLYWRTDLLERPPASLDEMVRQAGDTIRRSTVPYGFVWQGARYEGLVCVFLEILGAFGGRMMDDAGRIVVDSRAGVEALEWMKRAIHVSGISPEPVLTWQEEQVRFAFQNGEAVFMRNWPYAGALMRDASSSDVAGRFAIAAVPASPGGAPTAALGGSQLAINAHSDEPDAAWAVIDYLTRPEQMLERARVAGQYPARTSLYDGEALDGVFAVTPDQARRIIEGAVPRPVTPVYTEISGRLQVRLHRALTGQEEPAAALKNAAGEMRRVLIQAGLLPDDEGT
jgi:multiple sugar transport system substrate-binding protein